MNECILNVLPQCCLYLCTYHFLFLNEHKLILLLTQAKAQCCVCCYLTDYVSGLSHCMFPLQHFACLSSARLGERQEVFCYIALLTCWLQATFVVRVNIENLLKMISGRDS